MGASLNRTKINSNSNFRMPINIDPGVHSSLNLEQLAAQSGGFHPVATLPTIAEAKVVDSDSPSSPDSQLEIKTTRPPRPHRNSESSEGNPNEFGNKNMPRNASQPAFTTHIQGENILFFCFVCASTN